MCQRKMRGKYVLMASNILSFFWEEGDKTTYRDEHSLAIAKAEAST